MERVHNIRFSNSSALYVGIRLLGSKGHNSNLLSLCRQESIARDLDPTAEKPLWPLSSYGPAKYQPNIVSGLDESPEELRVKAVAALKSNSVDSYVRRSRLLIGPAEVNHRFRSNTRQSE